MLWNFLRIIFILFCRLLFAWFRTWRICYSYLILLWNEFIIYVKFLSSWLIFFYTLFSVFIIKFCIIPNFLSKKFFLVRSNCIVNLLIIILILFYFPERSVVLCFKTIRHYFIRSKTFICHVFRINVRIGILH